MVLSVLSPELLTFQERADGERHLHTGPPGLPQHPWHTDQPHRTGHIGVWGPQTPHPGLRARSLLWVPLSPPDSYVEALTSSLSEGGEHKALRKVSKVGAPGWLSC